MRNSSIRIPLTSLLPALLTAFAWLFTACPEVAAQGFYKTYPPLFNGLRTPERILLLPGGGYGLPISARDEYAIADLRTDDQGNTVFLKQNNHAAFWRPNKSLVTNDGHYVVVDSSFGIPHQMKMQWFDLDDVLLDTRIYSIDPLLNFIEARTISDDTGNLYMSAICSNGVNSTKLYSLKFAPNGDLLAQTDLIVAPPLLNQNTQLGKLVLGDDGALLIEIQSSAAGSVLRQNPNGTVDWVIPIAAGTALTGLAGNASGGSLLLQTVNQFNGSASTQIVYTDQTQTVTWSVSVNTLIGSAISNGFFALPLADGGWACVVGPATPNLQQYQVNIVKIDANGALIWNKVVPFFSFWLNACSAGRELADGSLLFGGNYGEFPFLLKLNADGTVYPHKITGQVLRDENLDCLVDAGDTPQENRAVRAKRQSDGLDLYALTDASGHYIIDDLDTGTYIVDVPLNTYQWQVCGTPVTVTFSDPNTPSTATADFQLQSLYDCPFFWVSIGTGALRVCQPNEYVLDYCNTGTETATGAYVELTLPAEFTIDSASAVYTPVGPNVLHFEVGDVPVNGCGVLYIYATLDCNPDLVGQTLCAQATAYPDTTCYPAPSGNWSGATIQVQGICDADAVRFEIKNVGDWDMIAAQDFVIVDDHVISLQGDFDLDAGETKTIVLPKDGSTWRISAEQALNHPLGSAPATLAVEGCVTGGGPFTTGMVNLFSNSTGNSLFDTDCRTVLNSYDPNEKMAFPEGVDAEHFIEANTPIEYQINFQNTGTAPAYQVVLRDTLSAKLNPASIRMGAASHPYTWNLSGPGILSVYFADINLPDSNSNEADSHGFVKFSLEQQQDNPVGTLIENRAGIFFDFNPAILTNTVYHTIGHDFLEVVATENPAAVSIRVSVLPNPVAEAAWLIFEPANEGTKLFSLFDVQGKVVRTQEFSDEKMLFERKGLPAGAYFFSVTNRNGMHMAGGKMLLR